jgi:hypothetical protein
MNDFDFLEGEWNVENRWLKRFLDDCDEWEDLPGRSTCIRLFGGAGNIDWIDFPTIEKKGLTLRLWRPATEDWALYWANDTTGVLFPPVFGGFSEGVGTFFGDDTQNGRQVRVRFIWSGIDDGAPRWEQAFSTDDEKTWETNWIMSFTRT